MMDYTFRIDDILGMIATEIQMTIISYHPTGKFTALALRQDQGRWAEGGLGAFTSSLC